MANIPITKTNKLIIEDPSDGDVNLDKILTYDVLTKEVKKVDFSIPSGDLTIEKTVTSDISTGVDWHGKAVVLNNDATTRIVTINDELNCSGLKTNAGTIIFAQGVGRALILVDNIANLNGAIGSAFAIISVGTTDYLYINNK